MMKNLLSTLVIALFFTSNPATALPISIDFSGDIYTVGSSISGDGVSVGDTVTGQFIYDTMAVDSSSTNTSLGIYSAQSFSIMFSSGFSATSLDTTVRVQNDMQNGSATLPADGLTVRANSVSGDTLNGRSIDAFQFGLRQENADGDLWYDDAIPDESDWTAVSLAAINSPDWHWMQFEQLSDNSIFDSQIRWNVTSYGVNTAVPEPGTIALLGLGIFALGFGRWRDND